MAAAVDRSPRVLLIRGAKDECGYFHAPKIDCLIASLSEKAIVSLVEVSTIDAMRETLSANREVNALVILGHGNEETIVLGEGERLTYRSLNEGMFDLLRADCSITFFSCSTAVLASRVAEATGRLIFAPVYDLYEQDFDVNPYFGTRSPYPILLDDSNIYTPLSEIIPIAAPEESRLALLSSYCEGLSSEFAAYIEWIGDEDFELLLNILPRIMHEERVDGKTLHHICERLLSLEETAVEGCISMVALFYELYDVASIETILSLLTFAEETEESFQEIFHFIEAIIHNFRMPHPSESDLLSFIQTILICPVEHLETVYCFLNIYFRERERAPTLYKIHLCIQILLSNYDLNYISNLISV